jgi:NADH pyrophosphatase NudC (nudix superfamily)
MEKFYASVSAIIYSDDKILLVSPGDNKQWQTVTGWVENETLNQAIIREIKEELGDINIQNIDVIDTHTFTYKTKILISTFSLIKYNFGKIKTSDDIFGYEYKWFSFGETKGINITCPQQFQIIEKAFFLMDQYKNKENSIPFLKYNWE